MQNIVKTNTFNVVNITTVQTMTTREIAELTGKEHRNVLADTRKMLEELHGEEGLLSFQQSYVNEQNKTQPMFALPKRESLILVSGYSVAMRAKIIDRWQELELQQSVKLPQTFAQALALAAQQALELEQKEQALLEAAPKVEYVDKYVERYNLRKITDVAKELGVSSKVLCKWLRDNDYLWKRTDKLLWKQDFMYKGYGVHKHSTTGSMEVTTALLTPEGDIFVKQRFSKKK